MEDETKKRVRCAKILWQSRSKANISMERMAEMLDISVNTVSNWERGKTAPDIFQLGEWFNACGLQPMPYILSYLHPYEIDGIDALDSDERITQALHNAIDELSSIEKRELLFAFFGNHGSDPYSILQLAVAYLHTPLCNRVPTAHLIYENYRIADALNQTMCPQNIAPDIDSLASSLGKAKTAVLNGSNGYTTMEK